jgi:hypothetical protein
MYFSNQTTYLDQYLWKSVKELFKAIFFVDLKTITRMWSSWFWSTLNGKKLEIRMV